MEIETRPYLNGIEERATNENENDMILGLRLKDIPFESKATAEKRAQETKAKEVKAAQQTKEAQKAQKAKEVKAAQEAQREKDLKVYHENLRATINKYK